VDRLSRPAQIATHAGYAEWLANYTVNKTAAQSGE
jgi:hypothetical protein